MIRLTDEEIKKRWLGAYEEQELTNEDYDLVYLSNNLYYEDMYALRAVAKAQLKKDMEWGNEYCVYHPQLLPNGSLYSSLHRRQCDECWQSLSEEVKE